ncbi:putative membrane lipoprotein [Forsythia ovata]|uniref:Membrane lipoprotein n=1 Tax=Forsythia ovata TaxID=205694 RepID=A0ABD1RIN4_9LAMI
MRIRKHARISPLIYGASSLKPGTVLQTHVCQLNQSPWDVMSFSPPSTPQPLLPPPSFQINGNDSFARNGSLGESIAAFESAGSMKFAADDEVTRDIKAPKLDYSHRGSPGGSASDKAEEGAVNPELKKDKQTGYCSKTNGNLALPMAKKQVKMAADSRRRPRAKKAASTLSSSNQYEFYYYSGFGPRWGKKRGENKWISRPKNDYRYNDMSQPTSSQIDNEKSKFEDEVEYEEEYEVNGESGRKRARKPIKARSLKSLM